MMRDEVKPLKKAGMLFLFLLLLIGCQDKERLNINLSSERELAISPKLPFHIKRDNEWKPMTDSALGSVHGWLGNDTILYTRYYKDKTYVMAYHIFNGELEKLYESNFPITGVHPNYNQKYILIQSNGNQNKTLLTIIKAAGDTVYKKIADASQIDFRWSPFEPEDLLVTYYYDDQSTKVEIMNMLEPTNSKELPVQPYVKWLNENAVIYFDWANTQKMSANLYKYDLGSEEHVLLEEDVTDFDTSKDLLMIAKTNTEDNKLNFKFHDTKGNHEQVSSLDIPLLQSNSSYYWTPSYDWGTSPTKFFTFTPKQASNLLEYTQGYEVIAYNVQEESRSTLLKTVPHSNLKCSPNGQYCLYGYLLTEIINVDSKEEATIIHRNENSSS